MDQQELISWAGVIFGLIICTGALLFAFASLFKISRREGKWTFDVEVHVERILGAMFLFWVGAVVMDWGFEYGLLIIN